MTITEPPQQDVAMPIDQARDLHRAGQFENAVAVCQKILASEPEHAETNYRMGLLAVELKQFESGLPYFEAALNADPSRGPYWLGYIDALSQAGQQQGAREVLGLARQHGLDGEAVEALSKQLGESEKDARGEAQSGQNQAPSPQEADALIALFSARRYAEALVMARQMTETYPGHWIGWKMLGVVQQQMGRNAEALAPMEKAAALLPHDAETHNNLGIVLQSLGRLKDAEASYHRALAINPAYAQAHSNLGSTLQALEQLEEAEASYRRALQLEPDYARAHSNLGATLLGLARFNEAETNCRRALQIDPENAEALCNLGMALKEMGLLDEAEASYRRAIQIQPDFADALNNLALLLTTKNLWMEALNSIQQSLAIQDTPEAKSIFVACVKHLQFTHADSEMRSAMVRALIEPWARPSNLAAACIGLLKLNPAISRCIARAADAWPLRQSAQDLYGSSDFAGVVEDPLLCALLDVTPVCDAGMERFLTLARCALLVVASATGDSGDETGPAVNFHAALARQCFINEYVFSYTDDEIRQASGLRDALSGALAANAAIPNHRLIAVAAYFPLYSLPLAHKLLERQWPAEVTAVLTQQIREPAEEMQIRSTILRLTSIEDEVSLLVQNQYEENPYPRWVRIPPAGKAKTMAALLHDKFPLVTMEAGALHNSTDILIAGCGTGQHSIGTAQRFQDAQVLAVDLSMSSLSYAKRKTRELGVRSIEYAQADLLKLGALGRSFDVIESVGVLHHLADPWAGWKVLLSLLRPGGFMRLGFYSEAARRNVVRIRTLIAERGYGSTADEIRRCRQEVMDLDQSADFGTTIKSPDFFSISACRDLLFHVQEHRMVLSDIESFLGQNNLQFLGFEIEADILDAYRARFPADRAATNLALWQVFENEKPDTFFGMYQFWIRKADQPT